MAWIFVRGKNHGLNSQPGDIWREELKDDGYKPSVLSNLLDGTIEQIRANCFKALHCLYIAVDVSIADDVNSKVKAYITALENRGNASAV